MKERTNPFLDPAEAAGYQDWYATRGRRALRLERRLLAKLLERFQGARTVLEVGCGTGEFTRWFRDRGLEATGLDSSRPMLNEAVAWGTECCVQADASMLPFDTAAFDLVVFITALEFVSHPEAALAEAGRVARRGLILGVLNRVSALGWRYRLSGELSDAARLFTPAELGRLVQRALGPAEIRWNTTLWPMWPTSLPLPWGGFIGMAVRL